MGNATYNSGIPGVAPTQIDHILISDRLRSRCTNCKVKWKQTLIRHGDRLDHGLVQMWFRFRLNRVVKSSKITNWRALSYTNVKAEAEPVRKFREAYRQSARPESTEELTDRRISVRPRVTPAVEAQTMFQNLVERVKEAAKVLPEVPGFPRHVIYASCDVTRK